MIEPVDDALIFKALLKRVTGERFLADLAKGEPLALETIEVVRAHFKDRQIPGEVVG